MTIKELKNELNEYNDDEEICMEILGLNGRSTSSDELDNIFECISEHKTKICFQGFMY